MDDVRGVTCPLPEHPVLADVAGALNASGTWGYVFDHRWRLVYMTDELRLSMGALRELVPVPLGELIVAPAAIEMMLGWSGRIFSLEAYRNILLGVGPWLLADLGQPVEEVRALVDPRLADALDGVEPSDPGTATVYRMPAHSFAGGETLDVVNTAIRLRDADGAHAGTCVVVKPGVGTRVLGMLAAGGDLGHFERTAAVARAARRPAAILFGDLEASSPLARRLSTASYFALGRRLVRASDRCVVEAGGLVGRHAGDGVVALFLAEQAGSESAAARACIAAARALREAAAEIARRSGLEPEDVTLRFGLHWGATLHVGHVMTAARAEVNALGDEMNETARVEACAVGGRVLASKALVERLDAGDAEALGLDPNRIAYTPLGELTTATEKARRDAPAIAVCEV